MEKSRIPSRQPLRAVLFDAYGTLFDVYSVGLLAEQLFPGRGQALGVMWRDKQIEYTHLVSTSNHGAHYQPFWDVTRAALRYACKRLGLDLRSGPEEQLMNQYRCLTAFPENREVLQALNALGPQATGVPVPQTAFVSCNSWDALAATWFGYQTLWVNRNQLPFEELGTQPLYTGSSLRDVLALPFGDKPA